MKYNIQLIDVKHKIIVRNVWLGIFYFSILSLTASKEENYFLDVGYQCIQYNLDFFFKFDTERLNNILDGEIYEI